MKKMRIGIFTEWFLPQTGGGETYVLEQACWLARKGMEVHLFIPDYLFKQLSPAQRRKFPFTLHRLQTAYAKYFGKKNLMTGHYTNSWASVNELALSNYEYVQAIPLDVFHIHSIGYAYMGIMLGRMLQVPTVVTLHLNYLTVPLFSCAPSCRGFDPAACYACKNQPAWLLNQREKVWDMGLRKYHSENADCLISLTHNFKEDLLSYQHLRNRIEVIPNGVNCQLFKPGKKAPELMRRFGLEPSDTVILFVGRIYSLKGIEFLLKAMPGIRRVIPSAKLLIAGRIEGERNKPGYFFSLSQLIRRLRLQQTVIFTHDLTYASMPAIYRLADILVHPSLMETQGLVLLEAMATKIPVVASDLENIREFIQHEQNGLLVSPKDVSGIRDNTIRLLQNEPLRKQLTENAYQTIRRSYTTDISFRQLRSVYHSLLPFSGSFKNPH